MNTVPVVTLALAFLTVVALVSVAVIVASSSLAPVVTALRPARGWIADELAVNGVRLAWVVALVATLGSLFFSEVAHFEPCRLCWFQRIAMYPLVVVLGVGAARADRSVVRYALPLALIGLPISIYHYLVEWFPALEGGACDPSNPCSLVWFREFGFITLPFMAATAFVFIATSLVFVARAGRRDTDGDLP